jgi:uncharacterized protein YyaL (SSP411 family)
MLYDQAQLAHAYLDGYQLSRDPFFSKVAGQIFAYVLRDMRDPCGGFYSAEDADSENPYQVGEHGEGAFYLWTEEEIVKTVGSDAANIFNHSYGVEFDGNVEQDPMGEFSGRNILYRAHGAEEAGLRFQLSAEDVESRLQVNREMLLKKRGQRRRPHLDDKIITSWNGMVIGALARGSRVLDDAGLLIAAKQAAAFVRGHLCQENNTLCRRYRGGAVGLAGQLDDYVFLVDGLLHLYQADQDPQWLSWAEALTEQQIALFWQPSGSFFYDSVADPSVRLRMKGEYDGAEPAGNSAAALNLIRLADLRGRDEWRDMAHQLIDSFADTINRYPPALPLMLTAQSRLEAASSQVVIAGDPKRADTRELLQVVWAQFDPNRTLLLADGGENQRYLAEKLSFIEEMGMLRGKATAYVCQNFTCEYPVSDPLLLQEQLEGTMKKPGA